MFDGPHLTPYAPISMIHMQTHPRCHRGRELHLLAFPANPL